MNPIIFPKYSSKRGLYILYLDIIDAQYAK